jgi:hypothetical protein
MIPRRSRSRNGATIAISTAEAPRSLRIECSTCRSLQSSIQEVSAGKSFNLRGIWCFKAGDEAIGLPVPGGAVTAIWTSAEAARGYFCEGDLRE